MPTTFTHLSLPIQEVMATVEAQYLFKNLVKLKSPPEKRNQNKYCRYHKDYGHHNEECFKLKVSIEKLIERGHLAEFITKDNQPKQDDNLTEQ